MTLGAPIISLQFSVFPSWTANRMTETSTAIDWKTPFINFIIYYCAPLLLLLPQTEAHSTCS